jgi:phage protein D
MQCQLGKTVLLLAIVSALSSAAIGAQTYKWTDAQGKVHYSDQPPPADVKEPITVKTPHQSPAAKPAGKDPAPAKAKTYTEQEADFKKRQVETAEREAAEKKKADEAAEKKQTCTQVRAQLKGLQAGGRITQTNANGNREYLSDAQIGQEIERLKKAEAGVCN